MEATRNEYPFLRVPPSQQLLAVHARLCQKPVAVGSRLIMCSQPLRGLLVCVSFQASHSAGLLSCSAPKSGPKSSLSMEHLRECLNLRGRTKLSNASVEPMSRWAQYALRLTRSRIALTRSFATSTRARSVSTSMSALASIIILK